MTKLFLFIAVLFSSLVAVAQEQTDIKASDENPFLKKGSWFLETNTGFGNIHPANTGLSYKVSNGLTSWNIGGEGGYFITDRLAVKVGLGYGNLATGPSSSGIGGEGGTGAGEAGEGGNGGGEAGESGSTTGASGTGGSAIAGLGSIFSYKIGAKYYLMDRIPLQVDFSGTSVKNYTNEFGFQAGYAFFFGQNKNISIEPGFRYSTPTTKKIGVIDDQFQFNVGFVIHL